MGALFSFSIYSGIILALLYLCYKWALSGENQHWFNRMALWLIYTASLAALPAAAFVSGLSAGKVVAEIPAQIPVVDIEDIPVTFDAVEAVDVNQPFYLTLLLVIYAVGMMVVLIHTLMIGFRLYRVIRQGEKRDVEGYTLVLISDDGIAPVSYTHLTLPTILRV